MLSILCASSQTDTAPASNLVLPEEHRAWAFRGERASVELLLTPPSPLYSIALVNNGAQHVSVLASEAAEGDDERLWQKLAGGVLRTDKEVKEGTARTRRREFVSAAGAAAPKAQVAQGLPPAAQSTLWRRIRLTCACSGMPADGSLAGLACIRVETAPPKQDERREVARADPAPTAAAPPAAPSSPHPAPSAPKRPSPDSSSPRGGAQAQGSPPTLHKHHRPSAPAASPRDADGGGADQKRPLDPKRQKLHNKAVFHGGGGGVVKLQPAQQAGRPGAGKAHSGSSDGGGAQGKAHACAATSGAGRGGAAQGNAHTGASSDGAAKAGAAQRRTPAQGDGRASQGGQGGGAQPQSGGRDAGGGGAAPKGAGGKDPRDALKGVKIVISGIQNPDRASMRDALRGMGAEYAADWGPGCTHLICAFPNTPKYRQVSALGGTIVSRAWVDKCIKAKARAQESLFFL